jgi:hypothetical protein
LKEIDADERLLHGEAAGKGTSATVIVGRNGAIHQCLAPSRLSMTRKTALGLSPSERRIMGDHSSPVRESPPIHCSLLALAIFRRVVSLSLANFFSSRHLNSFDDD